LLVQPNRAGKEMECVEIDNPMEEAEAVNAAEEWLLKARRVGRQIGERVKAALARDGAPTLNAPGVQPPTSWDD
jgi:hypothetical protein